VSAHVNLLLRFPWITPGVSSVITTALLGSRCAAAADMMHSIRSANHPAIIIDPIWLIIGCVGDGRRTTMRVLPLYIRTCVFIQSKVRGKEMVLS
jgi:hypothetical protein